MFTHQDVVKLWKADDLSGPLQRLWETRTGVYPLHAAQKIANYEKNLKISLWLTCFSFVFAIASTWIFYGSGLEVWLPLVSMFSLGGVINSVLMYATATGRHFTDAQWDFPGHLWKFIDWSGMRSDIIAGKGENDLRHIAKSILVETAKEILKREDEDERLRNLGSPHSLTEPIKQWKDLFTEQYRVLSDLGLVKGDHKPFYDAARTKLDEEVAVRAQTQTLA